MKSVTAQLQSITLGHFSSKWERRQEPVLCSWSRWGCCQQLLQPGGPTGEWCFQARTVKSSTTGINENIIFEGMIDSAEILIDFFSSLMTCSTCTIRQYCSQGTSGWISRCWQVYAQYTTFFLWDILEVWVELPAERWHSYLWRWPRRKTVRYFSRSHVLKNEAAPRPPALLLWTIKQLWGAPCSIGCGVYSFVHLCFLLINLMVELPGQK